MTATVALKQARTCYDHLAGQLGVAITDAMVAAGYIEVPVFGLSRDGLLWFRDALDIAPKSLFASQRPAARSCLDLTERRPHLAGAAGAALCRHFLTRNWIERSTPARAVDLTPAGQQTLCQLFAIEFPPLAGARP